MGPFAVLALVFAVQSAEDPLLGKIPAGFEIVPGSLRVADDGSRAACVVRKGEKEFPLVGDDLGTGFYSVWTPALHRSGKHVAFRVTKTTSRNATCSVIYNGRTVATDDYIGPVVLDPETGTPVYWVSSGWINNADGSLSHGPMTLHFGKAKGKKWVFASMQHAPSFPARGGSVFSVGSRGGDLTILRLDSKGKEQALEQDASSPIEVVVSPDGSEIAYTYLTNANKPSYSDDPSLCAVRRERIEGRDPKKPAPNESAGYESAGSPVFSPDGTHLAFRARAGNKFGVVLDHRSDVALEFDFVDAVSINPKSGVLAYRAAMGCKIEGEIEDSVLHGAEAKGGKWFVVFGEERSKQYEAVGEPVWSPDGSRCAYAAQTDSGWRVFHERLSSEAYDEISPLVWTPDGRSVQFAGLVDGEIRWSRLEVE